MREARKAWSRRSVPNSTWAPKPKKEKSRDMKRVEEELSDLLMAAVEVRVKTP